MTVSAIKLEKHFEALLQEALIEAGRHVVPLPDDVKIGLASGDARSGKAKTKPYDFGSVNKGRYSAIECKLIKGLTLYGEKIEPHQHLGLRSAANAGAFAFLAVFFMKKLKGGIVRQGFLMDYVGSMGLDKPRDFTYDWCVKYGFPLRVEYDKFKIGGDQVC